MTCHSECGLRIALLSEIYLKISRVIVSICEPTMIYVSHGVKDVCNCKAVNGPGDLAQSANVANEWVCWGPHSSLLVGYERSTEKSTPR